MSELTKCPEFLLALREAQDALAIVVGWSSYDSIQIRKAKKALARIEHPGQRGE